MIYVIEEVYKSRYTIMCMYTENIAEVFRGRLQQLIEMGLVINAKIEDNKVVLSDWVSELGKESINEALAYRSKDGYILFNRLGEIYSLDDIENEHFNIVNSMDGTYVDVMSIDYNRQLDREVKIKYDRYIYKGRLTGMDMSFEYEIIGDKVIVVDYTGSSNRFIVPEFVDIVLDLNEMRELGIDVVLNKKCKSIGLLTKGDYLYR